ncbi:hypothetical protein [Kineococcus sp. R86509]|uniref:hypothetical protein n=1 Tax=Kineococcus sp. R86509 TaxID=3093851 RepID=UPI0036D3B12C
MSDFFNLIATAPSAFLQTVQFFLLITTTLVLCRFVDRHLPRPGPACTSDQARAVQRHRCLALVTVVGCVLLTWGVVTGTADPVEAVTALVALIKG